MKLTIKPSTKNSYPIGGFLIKNASVKEWVYEIQELSFSLEQLKIYAIPGKVANSIWGCFILPAIELTPFNVGRNELCQRVSLNLYIPEKSILSPILTENDKKTLFKDSIHIFHPEFGLVKLEKDVNFNELILKPWKSDEEVRKPTESVSIAKRILSFQVKTRSHEDVFRNLEENLFPKRERLNEKPLSLFEETKLEFLKSIFKEKGNNSEDNEVDEEKLLTQFGTFIKFLSGKSNSWLNNWQQDYQQLYERNKRELEKLMDMLKKNPEEALKYAIPIDNNSSNRGGAASEFRLSKRWFNFSLFSDSNRSSGGGTVEFNDKINQLTAQYRKTAEELIKKGDYQKAAFVYMKLLKDYYQAAQTLEKGELYAEAGMVYLKHTNNKRKAAECFEKAKMFGEAIDVYEELGDYEKVGDLYLVLNNRKRANEFFEKAAEVLKTRDAYVQASLIYKNKIMDKEKAQEILLEGWDLRKNGFACLCTYFANILDLKLLKKEIDDVYRKKTNDLNTETFLKVLKKEYEKENELSDHIREIAYETIATLVKSKPEIVVELKDLNPHDKIIAKEIGRFRLNYNK